MGWLTDGWEEQRLVLGVGEYRARHRRAAPGRVPPGFSPDAPGPALPIRSLRFQVERVLLLFDEVAGPARRPPERPQATLLRPLRAYEDSSAGGRAAKPD